MLNKLTKLALMASLAVPMSSYAQSLEDRVAELEANQSLNIFNFSGYLGTRYDDVAAEQTDPGAPQAFDTHTQHMRLRAGLNVNANVSSKINFYSTFAMSKYFNSWTTQNSGSGTAPSYLTDPTVSRDELGSQIYLEKAYADYKMSDSFVLSFGRLPTFDGPPSHLPTGKARMGTYPSMGYNAPFDGFALSYNLGLDKQNFSARVLYTPMTQYTSNTGRLLAPPDGLGTVTYANQKINSISDFYSVMLEYGIDGTAVANKISLLAMAYQTGNLPINGADIDGTALGGGTGSGLVEFKVGGQVIVAEFSQIMDTGLDLAVTFLNSKVDNSGVITGALASGPIYGFGAGSEGESLTGNSTLVSARYKWNDMFVGAEYLAGGKNVFNYDPATEVVNGFYSTPGTGTHVYGLYKLTPELGLRLGYMKQEYKSTPFTFGASSDTDREITTYYADLRLDF